LQVNTAACKPFRFQVKAKKKSAVRLGFFRGFSIPTGSQDGVQ
jgi:hypothetical protein